MLADEIAPISLEHPLLSNEVGGCSCFRERTGEQNRIAIRDRNGNTLPSQ